MFSGRAVERGGSHISLGDPNVLDSGDGNFIAVGYAGSGDFKKACRKGDLGPRRGEYAVAGVGYIYRKNLEVEAKGPNVGLGSSSGPDGTRIMCQAELGSYSSTVGPVKTKVAVSFETGVELSQKQLELKYLGTGFSFGRKMGFSLSGFGFEFELC